MDVIKDYAGVAIPDQEYARRVSASDKKIGDYQNTVRQELDKYLADGADNDPCYLSLSAKKLFDHALVVFNCLKNRSADTDANLLDNFFDVFFIPYLRLEERLRRIKPLLKAATYQHWPKKRGSYPLADTPKDSALDTAIAFAEKIVSASTKTARQIGMMNERGEYDKLHVHEIRGDLLNVKGEQQLVYGCGKRPERRIYEWYRCLEKEFEHDTLNHVERDRDTLLAMIDAEWTKCNATISHPVICLADAVYNVENEAECWKLEYACLQSALDKDDISRGRSPNQQDRQKAREDYNLATNKLIAVIDRAVTAIVGVDQYIRITKGTRPGEWTTELKAKLTAFRSAIQTEGYTLFCEANFQNWRTRLNYFHEKQRFLRNVDISAFDEIDNQQKPKPIATVAKEEAAPQTIAKKVDDLVRDPKIMTVFKKHIEEYAKKDHAYKLAMEIVQKKEDEALEAIIQDKRLQDKKAGPPGDGWTWELFFNETVDKEGIFCEHEIEGWVPPIEIQVPPNPWPWGNTSDGQMTTEEIRPAQYFFLAACHDYYLFGKRPLIMTEGFMLKLEEKYPKTCAGIYRSYDTDSAVGMILRVHEEHLAPALADVISENISGIVEPVKTLTTEKEKKKKRPTKKDMKNRDRAVLLAAVDLAQPENLNRLPTVKEIVDETGYTPKEIYATGAYRDGKISKVSAILTTENTGGSETDSEYFDNKSIEGSRANRKHKARQEELDEKIDDGF